MSRVGASHRVVFGLLLWQVVAVTGLPAAQAQPRPGGMPNLRDVSGRPLPDRSMAAGMVSVRVAAKTLANPVANTEVVAIVEAPGGESRKRTAKTDAEGRAIFAGLRPGDRFRAEVQGDGETTKSDTFTLPDAGGTRIMLVTGLGAPGAPGAGAGTAEPEGGGAEGEATGEGAGQPTFTLGMVSGTAEVDSQLARGTIAVTAYDEGGRPLAQQTVEVGQVAADGQVHVTKQPTDAAGKTTFTGVGAGAPPPPAKADGTPSTTSGVAAAVVMSVGALRVGTDGFALPIQGGIRVTLRVPERTADPSVIRVGAGGRFVLQVRDDALSFIETLPLENTSGKIFDPGPGGIEVPLPSEAVNAEGAEGEHKIEIRKGIGVAVHGIIPPRRPLAPDQKSPDEITFGFVMPGRGANLTFVQRFPNGLGEYTFVTEQLPGLNIESEQITGRQERELGGKKYWLMRGVPIAPGGTLRFEIKGLPAPERTGKIVAAALALGLLAAAIALSRRPKSGPGSAKGSDRGRLVDRREKLFAELVTLESRRTALVPPAAAVSTAAGGAGALGNPAAAAAVSSARTELVRKLEGVYRELAALEDRQAV